jgi:polysaccharide export outer membrane protein
MLRGAVCALVLAMCSLYATAQSTASIHDVVPAASSHPSASDAGSSADTSSVTASEPLISPGDLIELRVFGAPEMTQELRVSGKGEAMAPLVGLVKIGGLTAAEAQKAIEAALKDGGFMRNPRVSLFTKEYAMQGVTLLGEVGRPGVYPMLGQRRLYDVISLAGGMTPRAGRTVSISRRSEPDKPIHYVLNNDPSKSMELNVEIFPGDTVVVSRAGVVYVVGSVAKPSGFTMEHNDRLTVLEAIALAGGTSPGAALNGAKIIRRGDNEVEEIRTPLKPILTAKSQDVALKPGDILFIPDNKAGTVARRGLESIVQITTGLAIYRR